MAHLPAPPKILQKLSETNSNNLELIRTFGSYTLDKIVKEELPTVGQLQKAYGSEKVELAITIIVCDLSKFFNNEIKEEQAQEIAIEFTSGILRNVTLEGIFLTCQKIKRSDLKFKLSANIILKEMHKHLEEQSDLIMQNNYNKHLAHQFSGDRNAPIQNELYAKFKLEHTLKNKK